MTADVRLRVVADDVGQSTAIDDGVLALARAGHLTAASVLVRAPGALRAMAALDGIVELGVHVQLAPGDIAGADTDRVAALITAQVEAMIAAGHSPVHLDLHTAALYGLGEQAVRSGGVVAEAITVAAHYRLRFRLPRRAPAGLTAAQTAAHEQAVAAAAVAGVTLPEVLVTEVPDAAAVPAFLAGLPGLLRAGGTEGAITSPQRTGDGYGLSPGPGPAVEPEVGEVELVTHPALRADPGDSLGRERVRQYTLLASDGLHHR